MEETKEKKTTNTITLKGVEYGMKVGMKAIVVFEYIAEKPFEIKDHTDLLTYIWASMLAYNKNLKLGFDEMLDAFDDEPEMFRKALEIAVPESAIEKLVRAANAEEGGNGIAAKGTEQEEGGSRRDEVGGMRDEVGKGIGGTEPKKG